MTPCPRAWEVEAARDDRVTGRARQAYDAHIQACASCASDAQALEALAQGLRGLGEGDVDDVSLRRLRNRVLDAADAEQTGRVRPGAGSARSRATIAVLVLAAMVLGAVAFASWRAPRPRGIQAMQAPPSPRPLSSQPSLLAPRAPLLTIVDGDETRVEVISADGARFTRTTDAEVDRFALTDGTLRLRVQRPAGGRRVLVVVPDGEIEDVGTAFEVAVADRRTERVSVHEGRVVIRLTDRAPVTVDAGKAWRRRPARANASATGSASASANGNGEREDAAYLEVVRLIRDGREGDARSAASRYLDDFPAGFRREEMGRVASGRRPR
jgi:hypothetical protein